MKANRKNIFNFIGIYLLVIFVTNLLYGMTVAPGFDGFVFILQNLFKPTIMPEDCNLWPILVQHLQTGQTFACGINYGYILLNIYFAVASYLLVFKKKLKLKHWLIAFIFFNLLVLAFVKLKDFLYG